MFTHLKTILSTFRLFIFMYFQVQKHFFCLKKPNKHIFYKCPANVMIINGNGRHTHSVLNLDNTDLNSVTKKSWFKGSWHQCVPVLHSFYISGNVCHLDVFQNVNNSQRGAAKQFITDSYHFWRLQSQERIRI